MNNPAFGQNRPTVAAIPALRSLGLRTTLVMAVVITTVIGATTWVELRQFERGVESELEETARLTAVAIADDFELLESPLKPDEVSRHLREFIDNVAELRSASIITMGPAGPVVFASTAQTQDSDRLSTGRRAIETSDIVWGNRDGSIRWVAMPVQREGRLYGAAAVAMSFASLERMRTAGRNVAILATVAACFFLFIATRLLARYFILRPINAIRGTMVAVGQGQLSVRAPVERDDEIGSIAAGLNLMLAQVDDLHFTLQQRVADATAELRSRNRELVEMYQQKFRIHEELGRTQRLAAIGETASAVAHQIGTPLNLVSGHIQLLKEELGSSHPASRRLEIAEEQIRKVTSTVRGLLDRARRPIDRERVDMSAIIRRICTLVHPALETAGVTLSLDCNTPAPVDGDELQIEMAILNLITNALDAMPGGGELRIAVRTADGRVNVEIGDTGTGIPAELVDRIFEPWVTTKGQGRGTGLGLSVTRSVFVEHGGGISVTSLPGRGSVFTIDLPVSSKGAEEYAQHG